MNFNRSGPLIFRYTLPALLVILFSFHSANLFSQREQNVRSVNVKAEDALHHWVDSVFNSLTFEEKIAQMFVIRAYSNRDERFNDSIARLIKKYNVGGVTFFQGGPVRQALLTNRWQRMAKTPLLITIDAENGLGMRLDSAWSFPVQMTLGALQNDSLIFETGKAVAEQCKRLGVRMNFAPVVDINSNPQNPVINYRSFGQNPSEVADKGVAYIRGHQSVGVFATAKHFPGHGDVGSDSHFTLPFLNHSRDVIDSIDLYPFKKAVRAGVSGVMVAHLFVPAVDSAKNRATSLSENAVSEILKKQLGFHGLAVTDALDMKGVTNYFKPGDIEVMALAAGNDILLLPLDIPKALRKIKKAVATGKINRKTIENSCRKILESKYRAGLDSLQPVDTAGLTEDLNRPRYELLNRKIFEQAVTVVKNVDNLIPLLRPDTLHIASLSVGAPANNPFGDMLAKYAPVDLFGLPSDPDLSSVNLVLHQLKEYNLVVVSIHNTTQSVNKHYGISHAAVELINRLKVMPGKVVFALFGNPYGLTLLGDASDIDVVVEGYEDKSAAKEITAQIIFGAMAAQGRLPVSCSATFPVGTGITTQAVGRLQYTIPEALGIPRQKLRIIDSIAQYGIAQKAYPGCQILFALDGKVFYDKCFGFQTYDKKRTVRCDDLYDLASVTKIAASALAMMKLVDEKRLDVDMPLSFYLPYLKNSNKRSKVIRDIMAHQAQLQPWIPYYRKTLLDSRPDPGIYSSAPKPGCTTQVAENLFIADSYRDTIFDTIVCSQLREKKEYKYSDLGYYLMYDAIQRITAQPLDRYVTDNFYRPLGLSTMGYLPLQRFPKNRIAPTERDTVFRNQVIRGYVHDPGAAMLGGVCGHAGLFSDATDLAVIMQMLLWNGYYGGKQYFDPATVHEFTKQQFPLDRNRRGICFDKPYPEYDSLGPCCRAASLRSFGHSGFTGTYTWADPENNLLYVFLSNRVFPDASNIKIVELNIRTQIHQAMYDILNEQNRKKLLYLKNIHR